MAVDEQGAGWPWAKEARYMDKVQIIRDDKGSPVAAVLPWAEYERLRDGSNEDAALIAAASSGTRNKDVCITCIFWASTPIC